MICVGIRSGIVAAVIDCPDEVTYNQFAPLFENLVDTSTLTQIPALGWQYVQSSNTFNYGQLSAVPSVKITKYAFEARLTPLEEGAIIGFALANLMLYVNDQQNVLFKAACQVLALLRRQSNTSFVDLQRADTIHGVEALIALGLVTSQRSNQILTTPPTYEEIYKG